MKVVKAFSHLQNSSVILPDVGEVKIPLNCLVELDDNLATLMVERGGWQYEKVEEEVLDISINTDNLDLLNIEDLLTLIKNAKRPKKEYKDIQNDRDALLQYIKGLANL